MLVKVIAENFKSFDNAIELTMVSSTKIRKNNDHKVTIKNVNLLKSAIVYGANASGKSNLIEVLRFMRFCVLKGLPLEAKQMYCRNKEENANKESVFEVQIVKGNKFYAYGFSAILNQRIIEEEWAYELLPGGDSRKIFERKAGESPQLGNKVNISATDRTKFQIYADDMAENKTTLFLTEMNRNKNIPDDSELILFKRIFEWFSKDLIIYSPNTPITNFEYYYETDSLEVVNRLIESFDTGISSVRIDRISIEDLNTKLPKEIFMDIVDEIKEKLSEGKHRNAKISLRYNKDFYNFAIDEQQDIEITTISLKHGNSAADFSFSEESDGTRRLFDLMDMLLKADNNETVYVVDELERSLHPKLTYHFIDLFKRFNEKKNVQLIFTTHEPTIMDQELFRRDEIWFVERDADNCSKLYSLDKFKERYDKKLSKAYLEGRYGAVPVFKSFKFAKEDE